MTTVWWCFGRVVYAVGTSTVFIFKTTLIAAKMTSTIETMETKRGVGKKVENVLAQKMVGKKANNKTKKLTQNDFDNTNLDTEHLLYNHPHFVMQKP